MNTWNVAPLNIKSLQQRKKQPDTIENRIKASIQKNRGTQKIQDVLSQGFYFISKLNLWLRGIILNGFVEMLDKMDDETQEFLLVINSIGEKDEEFQNELMRFLKEVSEKARIPLKEPTENEDYIVNIESYLNLVNDIFPVQGDFLKDYIQYLTNRISTLFSRNMLLSIINFANRMAIIFSYFRFREYILYFCPHIELDKPGLAFDELIGNTRIIEYFEKIEILKVHITVPPFEDNQINELYTLLDGYITSDSQYNFDFISKTRGNSSDGFIICVKDSNSSHNLYVKQFYLNSIKYRNPQLCGTDVSIRNLAEANKTTGTLPKLSTSSNKVIPTITDQKPTPQQKKPILKSNSSNRQAKISNSGQMKLGVEFFGYYLLELLGISPEFTVVNSYVYRQPLIVMRQIPEGFVFLSDHKDFSRYNLSKLCQNFELLRTIHFIFSIDDFNETNVAIRADEIMVVDLWTSVGKFDNLFADHTEVPYHSYQLEAFEKLYKYSLYSIIRNNNQLAESTISQNNKHRVFILIWLTLKAMELFQTKGDQIEGWKENNSLLHLKVFKRFLYDSIEKINSLGVGHYFMGNNSIGESYYPMVKLNCEKLFYDLSTHLFKKSYKKEDPYLKEEYELLIGQIKIDVDSFIFNESTRKFDLIDIIQEFQKRNEEFPANCGESKVILTYSPNKIIPKATVNAKYHIFSRTILMYDIIFCYFNSIQKKSKAGTINPNHRIYENCPSSLFNVVI